MKPSIAVVIPAIDEAASIGDAIRSAVDAGATEVVVADGGSRDATIDEAERAGATGIVNSPLGRGIQANAGAAATSGDLLLFLHADSRLNPHCLTQICTRADAVWGAFQQRIDSARFVYRTIEWGNGLRVRVCGVPFGDQAMWVRRAEFENQGGFANVPLMEDIEFSKRMRRVAWPCLLEGPVTVSARRWENNGAVRQTIRNWRLQAAFARGVSAETLQRKY